MKYFCSMKAEYGRITEITNAYPVYFFSKRMRRIINYLQIIFFRNFSYPLYIADISIYMDWQNCYCLFRYAIFYFLFINGIIF